MTASLRIVVLGSLVACAACTSDDQPEPRHDASLPPYDAGSGSDSGMPPLDASVPDTGVMQDASVEPADSGLDAALDGGEPDAAPDASEATVYAMPGERCELSERIGLIEISADVGGTPNVYGTIYDRPNPVFGAPELSSADCNFYRQATGCGPCGDTKICHPDGACGEVSNPLTTPRLRIVKGAIAQAIPTEERYGDIYGAVTLASPFGIELALGEQTVLLPETALPSGLSNVTGLLDGDYQFPEGVDLAWDGPEAGQVYTHVPMNHHVSQQTFTECSVAASAHALHIDRGMLEPLAVGTGLEFQGLKHTEYAAAQTATGCIEIRYSVHHYVSLF